MDSLQPVFDLDPRLHKKDWGSIEKNERDYIDWLHIHQVEYKFEGIVRREYLHHYYGMRAYDLGIILRKNYLLSSEDINSILQHLLYYNKHVEVDRLDQDDERLFMVYLRPRFEENVQYPYCIFCYEYYENMKMTKFDSDQ